VELRKHVGVEKIMFATDFPHIECEWPNTRSFIDKIYADIPEDEKYRMWVGNAVQYFKLDQVPHSQAAATGALTSA
jgi:predicted TIM-barrel fold metal-dependent hydrolase